VRNCRPSGWRNWRRQPGGTDASTTASTRERAFAAFLAGGDPRQAAVVALRISYNYHSKLGHAQESAWFRRAESLLDREPECVEHAHLARRRAAHAAATGELDEALRLAGHALDLATRYAERDLMALALHDLGRFRITKGEVEEGMSQLDEATLAAMHGEIGPYPTAVIYCNVIEACRNLADYRRAGEWTEAAKRWCERQAIAGFPGQCRVDRAEVMKLRGAWAEAEQEARDACDELKDFRLPVAARAFYELGEIRLRVGDYAGATDAFAQASELGLDPQPGLALLKLAEGNPAGAATAIARAVEDKPWDRLARARLLPAQVEIALAAGRGQVAQAAVEELQRIADAFGSDALRAHAGHARAAVHLAEGDAAGAVRSARDAWEFWQEIDAPYEGARARAILGEAYRKLGDDDAALLQLRAARAAFRELGPSRTRGGWRPSWTRSLQRRRRR
jgi:tetratricopeptide (TPR) repeat protein